MGTRCALAVALGLVIGLGAACGGGDEASTEPSPAFPAATGVAPPTSVTASPSPPATPGEQTYVVKEGDTLSEIAERFGTTVRALVRANDLENRDLIFPGQELTIPAPTG